MSRTAFQVHCLPLCGVTESIYHSGLRAPATCEFCREHFCELHLAACREICLPRCDRFTSQVNV